MNYAVIALSEEGARLGASLVYQFPGGTLYGKRIPGDVKGRKFFSLPDLVRDLFPAVDGMVFIMAAGIAVRMIAPYVKDKLTDPAVLVMDEMGRHVISLLSGHYGGANAWAIKVGQIVGAEPVITTATDVHGQMAPDVVAAELRLNVANPEILKVVNRVVADGQEVAWRIGELPRDLAVFYRESLAGRGIKVKKAGEKIADFIGAVIFIGKEEEKITSDLPVLYLCPRHITLGIGCKKGTPAPAIITLANWILEGSGISMSQVTDVASVSLKKNEKGLLDCARGLGKPVVFYSPEELEEVRKQYNLTGSSFVKKAAGVGNVCETAALAGKEHGKLIWAKTKGNGVTCALGMGD
jgi:cobalt-precorrin 5A hydrolase